MVGAQHTALPPAAPFPPQQNLHRINVRMKTIGCRAGQWSVNCIRSDRSNLCVESSERSGNKTTASSERLIGKLKQHFHPSSQKRAAVRTFDSGQLSSVDSIRKRFANMQCSGRSGLNVVPKNILVLIVMAFLTVSYLDWVASRDQH